ncbi:MAG: Kelch repeat-containing protein, partial [Phycisphaerales bacterium]
MLSKRAIIAVIGVQCAAMAPVAAQTCGSWQRQPVATAMSPRAEFSIAYDEARRQIVAFGGYDGGEPRDTWSWNGTAWQVLSTTGPAARRQYAMAYDSARGQVVMYGGVSDASTSVIRETWLWNGSSWTQSAVGPVGAQFCSLAFDSIRQVIVHFGGYGGQHRGETWEFNGSSWTQRASGGPSPRYGAGLAFDTVRRHCVLFGGVGSTGSALRDTWVWDGASWTQMTPQGEVPPGGFGVAMAFDEARAETLLFGGQSSAAETWSWNGAAWTRRSVQPPFGGNSAHSLAYDRDRQRVVLAGGTSATAAVWEWNGNAWEQRAVDTQPIGRTLAATAYDSTRQRVLLFGGNLASLRRLDDLWARTASGWTQLARGGPAGRSSAGIAYDDSRDRVVLFGGFNGLASLDDTWEFDGSSWSQLFPVARPSARFAYAMAYDSTRRKVVMFGGEGSTGLLNETWTWDGAVWSRMTPAVQPNARRNHSMVFDPVRRQVVMFGGLTSSTTYAADTWVWDGATWIQLATTIAPAARSSHQLAFETSRGRVVLVGGSNATTRFNDTWELDGVTWRNVGVNGPIARSGPSAAFDQSRAKVIVFGGTGPVQAAFSRAADTWEYSVTLPTIGQQPSGGVVATGTTQTISVVAVNSSSFEWRKNGTLLVDGGRVTGASTASLRIQGVQPSDSGTYGVTVINECGSVASELATLSVVTPPSIITQPVNVSVAAGGQASFSVVASGDPPLAYQWRRNGQPLADGGSVQGVSSASLTIQPASVSDAGFYSVSVTNAVGVATSSDATLAVLVPPAFTLQPSASSVLEGRSARFRATAVGSPTPSLQWTRNGAPLVAETRISGELSGELVIREVAPSDAGSFAAVATNAAGSVASQSATLSVGRASLGVEDVSTPATACLGSSFLVSWTGRNSGTMPAESGWTDRVVLSRNETLGDADDWVAGELSVAAVPGGGVASRSASVTIPDGAASGLGFIYVVSDPSGAVYFNDRTHDRSRSQAIEVRSPRLVATAVAHAAEASLGQPLAVSWTDRNDGNCAVPPYTVGLVLSMNPIRGDADDVSLGIVAVGALGPGETARRSASPIIPSGSPLGGATIFVVPDPSRSVAQSSREESEASGPRLVLGAPDLVIQSLTPPPNVRPNTSVQVAWTIANVGTAPAMGPWTESITGAGPPGTLPLGSFSVPAGFTLLPGQSVTRIQSVSVPGVPPGDGYSVIVC